MFNTEEVIKRNILMKHFIIQESQKLFTQINVNTSYAGSRKLELQDTIIFITSLGSTWTESSKHCLQDICLQVVKEFAIVLATRNMFFIPIDKLARNFIIVVQIFGLVYCITVLATRTTTIQILFCTI